MGVRHINRSSFTTHQPKVDTGTIYDETGRRARMGCVRGNGINYDTGFFPGTRNSRPTFDPDVARRELQVIASDLHCSAIRISGGDPARLTAAAEHAAAAGLEVWFSPFPCEMSPADLAPYFSECAERAEGLRQSRAEVVLVIGCELSVFASGFIPGGDAYARMATLASGDPAVWASLAHVPAQLNAFLAETLRAARQRFGGRVTYASAPWEEIDWAPFDIVAVDAYRDAQNAGHYLDDLRGRLSLGKPMAVTEFGCCTYRGAAARGATGRAIVDEKATPRRLNGDYVRDETEQAGYMRELLSLFNQEGVDSAFWFTFAGYGLPYDPDPAHDLDMASFGVVRVLGAPSGRGEHPEMSWEPKEAFYAMASCYRA